jgi:hypothetical protein
VLGRSAVVSPQPAVAIKKQILSLFMPPLFHSHKIAARVVPGSFFCSTGSRPHSQNASHPSVFKKSRPSEAAERAGNAAAATTDQRGGLQVFAEAKKNFSHPPINAPIRTNT